MDVISKTIFLEPPAVVKDGEFRMVDLQTAVTSKLRRHETPIRFVVHKSSQEGYECEVDVITHNRASSSIFDYKPRQRENVDQFNVALMIPTGIGCEVGGHTGDANVLSRVFASVCDNLVTHPNVVNAANYNEQLDNTLYVEGSVFTQLFMGRTCLRKVRKNRILLLVDQHESAYFNEELINAASTARITLGIDCKVHIMRNPISSEFVWSGAGRAAGKISHLERLLEEISHYTNDFDAVALSTSIAMPSENYELYFTTDEMNVNPWGGIEAMLTHAVTHKLGIPCAHAPLIGKEAWEKEFGVTDPRKSAESNSLADIHCVLKGLHKSPRLDSEGFGAQDISCLVIPDGCVGLPVLAAFDQGIPVIAVKENKNIMQNNFSDFPFRHKNLTVVENYWEALGVLQCLKQGTDPKIIRRPVEYTKLV